MREKIKPKYIVPILLMILAILNLIDWIMTDYCIKRGGVELNPISRWLMEHDSFNEVKFGGVMLQIFAAGFVGWVESKDIFKEVPHGASLYNVMVGVLILVIISYIAVIWIDVVQLGNL